jgi:hypothetical protein
MSADTRQAQPGLLPCPFCGCDCNQRGVPTPHKEGCWFKVNRDWRKAIDEELDFSLTQEVLDSWNRRALPPSSSAAVEPAHLYDLSYALDKLRLARRFVPHDANLYDNIGAAARGLEYVINQTKEVSAAPVCDSVQVGDSSKSEPPMVIGVDLAIGPDVTVHVLPDRTRTWLIATLEAARNGLKWYRDALPGADSGADDEMDAAIDEALVLLGAAEGDAE